MNRSHTIKRILGFIYTLLLINISNLSAASDFSAKSSEKNHSLPDEKSDVYSKDFTVAQWVKISGESSKFPALLGNKDWASGKVIDMTSTSNTGFTLGSGKSAGWAFHTQPNGAWAWNAGNGRTRLDYLPTAERQNIGDGKWHLLTFNFIAKRKEIRLFFDGINVAIYSTNGINNFSSGLPTHFHKDGKGKQVDMLGIKKLESESSIWSKALTDGEIFDLYKEKFPNAKPPKFEQPVTELNVMAWNIWHGGRHNGLHSGVEETVNIIKASKADIICMQETYGSGAIIADRLGYYFHLRSSNISVLSRYPLGETYDKFQSFRLGGVEVYPSKKQKINVFSLWIHYLPAWRSDSSKDGATEEALIKGEWKTRASEISGILKNLQPIINNADETPLIIAGDYNSPSHKDWINSTKAWHKGLTVKWPVSEIMEKQGFTDSYRHIQPDPTKILNEPNWQGGAERLTWRIDYIYHLGKKLETKQSTMWNIFKGSWPSDHPLVLSKMKLAK